MIYEDKLEKNWQEFQGESVLDSIGNLLVIGLILLLITAITVCGLLCKGRCGNALAKLR